MGYKDSFVDEFPYLVYSDDPEAIGGADPSGDPGIPYEDENRSAYIANSTGGNVEIIAASDMGRRELAYISLTPEVATCGISRKAYMVIPSRFSIEVHANSTDPETSVKLDPIGTVIIDPARSETGYVYPLDDADVETYEITAING